MHILFLGYSSLLKNRILPILNLIPEFDMISIAKFHEQTWDLSYSLLNRHVDLYNNYQDALETTKAEIVYITTVNSAHYEWAERFLKKGIHVIIDKPATLSLKETERLLYLARKNHKLVAEATVYLYHPQFSLIKEIFIREKSEPIFLNLSFSFPPLHFANFRYRKELGGGAVLDTGIYAISPGRYFFNAVPQEIYCTKDSFSNELLVSYSILARYSEGRSLIGHFGFTTEYINRMNILGDHISVDIDRVFTTPDNIGNEIKVKIRNISNNIMVPKSNMFIQFFNKVIGAIVKNDFEEFYDHLIMDAKAMQMIIDSVNK
jgi:NDP-hexose-3-ketoreductase